MVRKFFSFFCLFVLIEECSFAQGPLQNLYSSQNEISFIRTEKNRFFEEVDKTFSTHFYSLIRSRSGLFAWVNGTGRLYKAIEADTGIIFIRQDSTTHFGYNIAAFPFSYSGKIYNIGGYGLWRINGQLRVYNEKEKQWDIAKLNEEVPLMFDDINNLLWYDQQNGKLYLGYSTRRDEAVLTTEVDEAQNDYTVRVLDLKKNQWVKLGYLNNLLKEKIQNISTVAMLPWGQLIFIGSKINLLDFEKNKLLSLNVKVPYYQLLLRNWYSNTFYSKDSTLYFGNIKEKTLDSARIRYTDFDVVESSIFERENIFQQQKVLLITTISILIFLIVLWRLLQKKYRIVFQKKRAIRFVKLDYPTDKIVFEEKETILLKALITNSEKGRFTNIDELNRVLGISKKAFELQKKHRSDIITSVNKKFSFIYPDEVSVIQRKRSETDKRSYEYFIEFNQLSIIKELLNQKYNS